MLGIWSVLPPLKKFVLLAPDWDPNREIDQETCGVTVIVGILLFLELMCIAFFQATAKPSND